MNDLKSNNNFKGQTAESINSYNDSFHIETINRIEKLKKSLKVNLKVQSVLFIQMLIMTIVLY